MLEGSARGPVKVPWTKLSAPKESRLVEQAEPRIRASKCDGRGGYCQARGRVGCVGSAVSLRATSRFDA